MGGRQFQEEMLQYMPPKHVAFVRDFRKGFAACVQTPREYALECGGNVEVCIHPCLSNYFGSHDVYCRSGSCRFVRSSFEGM